MLATEADLEESRAACRRLEDQLHAAHGTVEQLRLSEEGVRSELKAEQLRTLAVQGNLDEARAECRRLEDEVQAACGTVQQLRADEAGYRVKLQALTDLSSQFDKVLNLKRESDESLWESRKQNSTLIETLQDRENEVKMLTADNVKLREKVVRLAAENDQLRAVKAELERLRDEKSGAVEPSADEENAAKDRLCVNQRLSFSEFRSSPEKVLSPGDRSEHTLLSEVESLRQVLALKTEEVSELRRLDLHLRVEADRVPKLLSLVTTLEAKVEDLQSQLSSQLDVVR